MLLLIKFKIILKKIYEYHAYIVLKPAYWVFLVSFVYFVCSTNLVQ